MQELIEANLPLVAIAVIALVLLAWWIFKATRRTRVSVEERSEGDTVARRNQALIDAPPAAGELSSAANTNKVAAAPASADAEAGASVAPTTQAPAQAASDVAASAPEFETPATPAPDTAVKKPAAPEPAAAVSNGDDLTRIKGLGPKLAAQLQAMGTTRIAQIAAWNDADIDRVDAQLGRFQGRIRRDNWVEQAKLLEGGDMAAYEGQFGKT